MPFTWNDPSYGLYRGTFQARDGHVHLVDIPAEDLERYEQISTELDNSLDRVPGTIAEISAFLESKGLPRVDFNPPHVGFGPIPVAAEEEAPLTPTDPPASPAPNPVVTSAASDPASLSDLLATAAALGIEQTEWPNRAALEAAIAEKQGQ